MSNNVLNFSANDAIQFISHEKSLTLIDMFVNKGYLIFSLNGHEIKSKEELLRYLARVMKFPDHFGQNWDALEECLNDLEWSSSKGYIIQFMNADSFIKICPSDFSIFVEIIKSTSIYWNTNKVKFLLLVETNIPTVTG
jgi:RNAse (barnase) inhibitor barstar